jgi:hypothetical protein
MRIIRSRGSPVSLSTRIIVTTSIPAPYREERNKDSTTEQGLSVFPCSIVPSYLLFYWLFSLRLLSVGLSVPVEVSTIRVFSMSLEDTFRYVVVVYQLLFFKGFWFRVFLLSSRSIFCLSSPTLLCYHLRLSFLLL